MQQLFSVGIESGFNLTIETLFLFVRDCPPINKT